MGISHLSIWSFPLAVTIICATAGLSYLYNRGASPSSTEPTRSLKEPSDSRRQDGSDDESRSSGKWNAGRDSSDPGLLQKHAATFSYTTSVATYPSIRTFFCPHVIDEPTPLPLLVVVHGLGGSLAQFHPLLTTLTHIAPSFGIDFPGCGQSLFERQPSAWSAYSTEALALLLMAAIETHPDAAKHQRIVLIAHSLGTAICSLLASPASQLTVGWKHEIAGFIAICPVAEPPPPHQISNMRKFFYVPETIFDLWRRFDRRGGPNSQSVSRFVGTGADSETRMLQLRFNEQSRTPVWRRMAWGALPAVKDGKPVGGVPGREVWSQIRDIPLFLIAGESDPVTKPTNVTKLLEFLGIAERKGDSGLTRSALVKVSPAMTIKALTFPAPASHALLYDRSTYRVLSGLIQDFLAEYADKRLSLGWQLQRLSSAGKWDVKNVKKWQAVTPVSGPIGGVFAVMKTLRDVDERHSPAAFAEEWKDRIYAVIDISHDRPVYDPTVLEEHGVQYHKLPTVSKIPPTKDEVRDFISLVDRLREEMAHRKETDQAANAATLLAVHCHYGFNRSGFFVVSYLVSRLGYTVQEGLDEFEKHRPPGIRHEHFIDTLFVRYSGLK